MNRRNRKQNASSLSLQSEKPQLTFWSYQQQVQRFKEKRRQERQQLYKREQSKSHAQFKDFTQQQREHLKNAFRYICRLAFKESSKYINKLREIFKKRNDMEAEDDNQFKDKLFGLLKDAQMISGERYFREYLTNLSRVDQFLITDYMIWFLQTKYLRYLKKTECEKGKRKNMKKQLYLRFKNQVMLPYLQNYLNQLEFQ